MYNHTCQNLNICLYIIESSKIFLYITALLYYTTTLQYILVCSSSTIIAMTLLYLMISSLKRRCIALRQCWLIHKTIEFIKLRFVLLDILNVHSKRAMVYIIWILFAKSLILNYLFAYLYHYSFSFVLH